MQSADNGCLDHTKARSACIRIWSQWGSIAPYGNKSTPSHGNRAEPTSGVLAGVLIASQWLSCSTNACHPTHLTNTSSLLSWTSGHVSCRSCMIPDLDALRLLSPILFSCLFRSSFAVPGLYRNDVYFALQDRESRT